MKTNGRTGLREQARGVAPERVESHFAFGENWLSFVATIDEHSIDAAVENLERLLPDGALRGRDVLDIGCGSGLAMIAAQRLGARSTKGIDLDPASVAAARQVLERFGVPGIGTAEVRSVFDLDPARDGRYDVVYSWGVLHHTGNMWKAIAAAAGMIKPGGRLVIAIYRKTPLCGLWKVEKRAYAHGPEIFRSIVRRIFAGLFKLGLLLRGESISDYRRSYRQNRGMDWAHDVHDWLGGWPYESATPDELIAALQSQDFRLERMFARKARLFGLFGSHCDEFVFVRAA